MLLFTSWPTARGAPGTPASASAIRICLYYCLYTNYCSCVRGHQAIGLFHQDSGASRKRNPFPILAYEFPSTSDSRSTVDNWTILTWNSISQLTNCITLKLRYFELLLFKLYFLHWSSALYFIWIFILNVFHINIVLQYLLRFLYLNGQIFKF